MPFKSQAQRGLFRLCKVAPSKVRGKCPPAKVVAEFIREDKGGKLPKPSKKAA